MRDAEASSFGITVGGKAISNLRYDYDTALIENIKETLERLTKNVNEVGKQLNLKLNVKKTKLMVSGSLKEVHNITIDGEKVGQDESFKYLGSTETTTAACSSDIKSRIAVAKWGLIELQDIWNDTNLYKDLKVRLVKALVWSAFISGAEAWTLFKSDENRIMAAEMWIWRRMLGVSWKEKRTNASILRKDNDSKTGLLRSHNER